MDKSTHTDKKMLPNVLDNIVDKYDINGWSCYESRSGFICINIRFEAGNVGQSVYARNANQVTQDQQHSQQPDQGHINKKTQLQPGIYYRRVSERQQLRNSNRIQAHKDSTNAKRTPNDEIEK